MPKRHARNMRLCITSMTYYLYCWKTIGYLWYWGKRSGVYWAPRAVSVFAKFNLGGQKVERHQLHWKMAASVNHTHVIQLGVNHPSLFSGVCRMTKKNSAPGEMISDYWPADDSDLMLLKWARRRKWAETSEILFGLLCFNWQNGREFVAIRFILT